MAGHGVIVIDRSRWANSAANGSLAFLDASLQRQLLSGRHISCSSAGQTRICHKRRLDVMQDCDDSVSDSGDL